MLLAGHADRTARNAPSDFKPFARSCNNSLTSPPFLLGTDLFKNQRRPTIRSLALDIREACSLRKLSLAFSHLNAQGTYFRIQAPGPYCLRKEFDGFRSRSW